MIYSAGVKAATTNVSLNPELAQFAHLDSEAHAFDSMPEYMRDLIRIPRAEQIKPDAFWATPRRFCLFAAFLLLTVSGEPMVAAPIGTALTYQGSLSASNQPANGLYDFQFSLLDAAAFGNSVAGPLSLPGVGVTSGVFTVSLDFGAGAFDGQARWLEIAVRTNSGGGTPHWRRDSS
jgi:hypothetical protein